VGMIA